MYVRMKHCLTFLLLLFTGVLLFVVFSHIKPLFSGPADWIGRLIFMLFFITATYIASKIIFLNDIRKLMFAFFIAALAMSIDYYSDSINLILNILKIPLLSPAGIAFDKLDSTLIIVGIIIIFTKLSGETLGSIFLKKGNLKKGLTIGIITFIVCVFGAAPVGTIFGAKNLSILKILPWTPWILIFITGNALNEELLFRGLFLNKIEPFLGPRLANLVIAIPFVLHHTGVNYTNDSIIFLMYLLPLSLVWGKITQKTGSLIGSVLFHAGTDLPIILVLFSNL